MKQFIFRYLNNRSCFYANVLERIPYAEFREAFRLATFPFEESDEVVKLIEALPDADSEEVIPRALLTEDLLKKHLTGEQLAKTTVSMREALMHAERIESIGVVLFDTLEKQELNSSRQWEALAANRRQSLMNILMLRDDLDFHRLKLI